MDYLPSQYIRNDDDFFMVGTNTENFEFIDRGVEIGSIESFLKTLQSIPIEKRNNKSNNKFMVIHGCPGSGKSRFIDELCAKINDENSLIIPITYNSVMTEYPPYVNSMIDRFYYRILYS